MSAINVISSDKLARLTGTLACPTPIEVRFDGGGAIVVLCLCSGTGAAPILSGAISMRAR
jgi:hypothetical protein